MQQHPTHHRPQSPWYTSFRPRRDLPLTEDLRVDVCVVGGGMAGMSVAYEAARQGREVALLEAGEIGSGQTARTSAHLSNAIDDRFVEMARLHGSSGARLAAASHTAAIDRIEAIIRSEQIDCDFQRVDGYLAAESQETADLLDRELAAAHAAGLTEVERIDRWPVPTFDSGPCLRFPRQAQFHPLRYLRGLARAIDRDGGRVFGDSRVQSIEAGPPGMVTTVEGHTVTADAVVVATNAPINDRDAIHTKQAPYVSYVIGARVMPETLPKALYWDTLEPYHYVRLHSFHAWQKNHPAYDLLIVGGEDQETGQADEAEARYAALEDWARTRFGELGTVDFRWSGQVMETSDGLALIGCNPGDEEHIFVATGDSGMGLTHGAIAGMLLSDLILRRDNPWAELYDPARTRRRTALDCTNDPANVDSPQPAPAEASTHR